MPFNLLNINKIKRKDHNRYKILNDKTVKGIMRLYYMENNGFNKVLIEKIILDQLQESLVKDYNKF